VPQQLTLSGIQCYEQAKFDNFYSGDNHACLASLQALKEVPQYVYLWGAAGSGRSHLLQACCQAMQQQHLTAFYLPLIEFKQAPMSILENIDQLDLVCIDDIDQIVGSAMWEEALFDFFNQSRAQGQALVISGGCPPRQLPMQLADLVSRLTSGLIFQIHPLDDQQKIFALQMRARNRGFELPEPVAQYLLHHCPRNASDLFALLEKLDEASLSAGRRVTIPFVKKILLD
jgi:DnaA-homolog protein